MLQRIFLYGGTIILAIAAIFITVRNNAPIPTDSSGPIHCVGENTNSFVCWRSHFAELTAGFGPKMALEDIKNLYKYNSYVISQCHQLTHVIGHGAIEKYPDISEAFTYGDPVCWSGYYHGAVEAAIRKLGRDGFIASADKLCSKISGKERYSFDYYNCVHGVGHGVMEMTADELFDSLELCKNLSGNWEQRSCFGGVFMENVMAEQRGQSDKYLKPDELLYPCNAVNEEFKEECYKMQTSYMLTKNGRSFKNVFENCAKADEKYRDTCAQSAGRDASGQSVSNVEQTIASCGFALDDNQKENCYIGAVKDFVSYFHGDKEARELCFSVGTKFQDTCERVMLAHYKTL
jgi:hypothetical protein